MLARGAGSRRRARPPHPHHRLSVERATLRTAGLAGADTEGIPWVNHLVDAVRPQVGLEHGRRAAGLGRAGRRGAPELTVLAQKAAVDGAVSTCPPVPARAGRWAAPGRTAARRHGADRRGPARRATGMVGSIGDPPQRPWIYLIVATGDIYEDIPQAQAAARAGADVIAVIRSTGQCLLDYVPQGATPEGYGGTYPHRRTSG